MKTSHKALTYGLLLGLYSASGVVHANPQGAEVVNGQVQFDHPDANTLAITNSTGAIINWQQFSIQQNEITKFIQPDASSAVLNRVVGGDPSSILGQLLSNGRVFLINPNGIVFGSDAIIDTAGLIASTLDMTNEDFINQNLAFQGENSADITNKGYIKAGENGDIFLIAPNIENSGIIETKGGQLILAAGESVTIASLDSDNIVFDVQAPENEIVNLGEMITNGGAAGMFAGTIKHGGSINADSISVDENGNVQLFAKADIEIDTDAVITANGSKGGDIKIKSESGTVWNAGTIEAKGNESNGGHVEVLGERIALLNDASINASGETDGGEVLIGGDYQGKNENVKNAKQTYVGENAIINADAITHGDGGKVIVWADETTQAYGKIFARGGTESGNGGFIETSGKKYLEIGVYTPDASAVNGDGGTWLLDPEDIDITAVNTNITQSGSGDPGPVNFTPTAINTVTTVNVANINTALNNGSNVVVDTSGGGVSTLGTITISSAISKTADGGSADGSTLTLNADNNIDINADISSTVGVLNITLDAARTTGSGAINLNNVNLNTNGGSITATAETVNVIGGTNINGNSNIGTLNLTGLGFLDILSGTTSVTGTTTINFGTTFQIAGGTFNPSGTVNNNGLVNLNTGTLSLGAGGTHTGGFSTAVGSVLQFTGGTHTFNSGSGIVGGGDVAFTGGTSTFNTSSIYTISGDTGISGGNAVFNINAVTSSLTHASGSFGGGSTGTITTSTWMPTSGVTLNDIGLLLVGPNTLAGVTVNTAGTASITNQSSLTLNGSTINPTLSNSGSLSFSGSGNMLAGTFTLASGSFVVNAGADVGMTSLVVNGGSVTTSGTINAPITLNAGALTGNGSVNGTVTNAGGIVAPGLSPGTLTITGNYNQGAGGTLLLELGGATTAGVDYDLLSVSGTTSLAGTLAVNLFGSYGGVVGDQFDIIQSTGALSGDFTTKLSPGLTFLSTPNILGTNNYQLEVISNTSDALTSTDEILALTTLQDEFNSLFTEDPVNTNDDDKDKKALACR